LQFQQGFLTYTSLRPSRRGLDDRRQAEDDHCKSRCDRAAVYEQRRRRTSLLHFLIPESTSRCAQRELGLYRSADQRKMFRRLIALRCVRPASLSDARPASASHGPGC
jgi:hypothetical protein